MFYCLAVVRKDRSRSRSRERKKTKRTRSSRDKSLEKALKSRDIPRKYHSPDSSEDDSKKYNHRTLSVDIRTCTGSCNFVLVVFLLPLMTHHLSLLL